MAELRVMHRPTPPVERAECDRSPCGADWVAGGRCRRLAAAPAAGSGGRPGTAPGPGRGVATRAEQLRDTLAAAAGVEQAILATATTTAPEPIRASVGELAAALDAAPRPGSRPGCGCGWPLAGPAPARRCG
jgi:hypothetical protein